MRITSLLAVVSLLISAPSIPEPVHGGELTRGLVILDPQGAAEGTNEFVGPRWPTSPVVPQPSRTAPRSRHIDGQLDEGGRAALVIGNQDYVSLSPLQNSWADAVLLADTFSGLGFAVSLQLDVSGEQLIAAVNQFVRDAAGADVVAFYYAGHGLEIAGENFIVPIDARLDDMQSLSESLVSINVIIEMLEQSSATTLVFVDACRENPFANTPEGLIGRGLAPMPSRPGTLITFATAPGQVAYDGLDINSFFAGALARNLPIPGLPVANAVTRVTSEVHKATDGLQTPWTHSSLLHDVVLMEPAGTSVAGTVRPQFDPDLAALLRDASDITVNGEVLPLVRGSDPEHVLDRVWERLSEGVNRIEAGGRSFRVWTEAQAAYLFGYGYDESHAVIVAIDEYPEVSGFHTEPLPFTRLHAEALADQLERMGFARENIVELYGPDATREAIEAALRPFIGQRDTRRRDRFVFYFGGHGVQFERVATDSAIGTILEGMLVPYDYDRRRPYQTSIFLSELRSRNLNMSNAHHTLLLIDACYAGLVLPRFAGDEEQAEATSAAAARRLALIRGDMEGPHGAVIVAGTNEQKALWQNGGLFTRVLIEGLAGSADANRDGLITYTELVSWLQEEVLGRSQEEGVRQVPSAFAVGSGRVFFERPL